MLFVSSENNICSLTLDAVKTKVFIKGIHNNPYFTTSKVVFKIKVQSSALLKQSMRCHNISFKHFLMGTYS